MVSAENYATTISAIYFSIYVLVFLIASIYCAYEVEQRHGLITRQISKSTKTKSTDIKSQIELSITTANEQKIDTKEDNIHNNDACDSLNAESNKSCFKRWKQFGKYWMRSLWTKKKIYISIVPHIFDQATDLGVIYTYYEIMRNPDQYVFENDKINMIAIFYASISVIIMHKVISCGAIYALTKNTMDVFLQFIDFMMIKAIYLNYKLNTEEPGNAQRYLQILEGTFESGPQILISILFITKTYDPNTGIDPIILISSISSIWTLTSRVTSDDKLLLKDEWKKMLLPNNKFPWVHFLNWRYFVRVVCWRFCEISSRVFILVLLWIALGGFALIIIMSIELFAVFILCFFGEGVIILGNMMYYTMTAVGKINTAILDAAATYKLCSPFVFLILITVFCMKPFEAWKVDDYTARHDVIQEPIKLFMFIYAWITSAIWVCSVGYIMVKGKTEQSSVREVSSLLISGQYTELLNLIEFGSPFGKIFPSVKTRNDNFSNVLLYIAMKENNDQSEKKALLFAKLYESNIQKANKMVNEKDYSGKQCLHYAVRNNLYITKYLINETKMVPDDSLLSEAIQTSKVDMILYLINEAGVDINSITKDYCFRNVVKKEDYEMIDFFTTKSDKYANWCLWIAAEFKNLKMVKYLVNNENINVDVHKTDQYGQTILFRINNAEMFRYFLDEHGVDFTVKNNSDTSCLFNLVQAIDDDDKASSDRLELLKELIEQRNANWIIVNSKGESLARVANDYDNQSAVDYIESLHTAKVEEYTYKEILRLMGLKSYISKFERLQWNDPIKWNELNDDQLRPLFTPTANENGDKLESALAEKLATLNVQVFNTKYRQWFVSKDKKKKLFEALFL